MALKFQELGIPKISECITTNHLFCAIKKATLFGLHAQNFGQVKHSALNRLKEFVISITEHIRYKMGENQLIDTQ